MSSGPPVLPAPTVVGVEVVGRSVDRAQVDRWALALLALGILHETRPDAEDPGVVCLWVRSVDAPRAQHTILEVDAEHVRERERVLQEQSRPRDHLPWWAALYTEALAAVLLGFTLWAGGRDEAREVFVRGTMDAGPVLMGEYHRLITAVSLHSDGAHLLSNLVFLAVVAPTVVHRLGPGVATLCFWVTGAVANAVSAGFNGPGFSNVGASGGVFGLCAALGLVAARSRESRIGRNRWLAGFGAVLALLSTLGFGEHADVVAHLAGFAAAIPLGLLMPLWPPRQPPALLVVVDVGLGVLAWMLPVLAWSRALQ